MNFLKFLFIGLISILAFTVQSKSQFAQVQIIHNVADLAAAEVDVYVNGAKALPNFKFRQATPYIPLPAGVDLTVAIQPSGSQSAENPLAQFEFNLVADEVYTIIASGIVSTNDYNPVKPFDLIATAGGRTEANNSDNIDVLVFHGSTDAPTVDVVETLLGAGTIVNDLSYGEFAGYLELPDENYTLEIRDETGAVTVAEYSAPLKSLGAKGLSATVFASGFLNPANNSNGPAFGLFVALADGNVIELPLATPASVVETINNNNMLVFPNPARDIVNISIESTETENSNIEIFDIYGSKVMTQSIGNLQNGLNNLPVKVAGLASGVYMVRVNNGNRISTAMINVVN